MNDSKISPMMVQWHSCKKTAGDALLLFRMGDFYEAFYEDAEIISRELDLTLTKRQEIPMSGVPHHTSEVYIDRLVAKGFKVAIAEQMEDPKQAKGLVKRGVARVVTPGSLMSSSLLSEKSNNFFASITRVGGLFGLAVLDLTTADFFAAEFTQETDLANEIYRLQPAELLISPKFREKNQTLLEDIRLSYQVLISVYEDWHFEHQEAHNFLLSHFHVRSLDGFGLHGMVAAINSAGALLSYLQDSLTLSINHIKELRTYSLSEYLSLDRATQKNLELTESLQGGRTNTLLSLLDRTLTPMGGRLLRQWIKQPLLDPGEINRRQEAVQALLQAPGVLEKLSKLLEGVRDLERLMMRIISGYANPRDILALQLSLEPISEIKHILSFLKVSGFLSEQEKLLHPLPQVVHLIQSAIVEDPPSRIHDGKIFRDGYCRELDELREIMRDSQAWIARYQGSLRESTGIKTIKIGFNKMFGYYIEVSRGQADKMPESFERRQTLVNAERFISPELKDYENKVLNAEERIHGIEIELFSALKQELAKFSEDVLKNAHSLGKLDAICSFALVAKQHGYVRPTVDHGLVLHIQEGRHPVIEAANGTERFIPNDTLMDDEKHRLLLLTGPNMAGKSTYIRQVALLVIMSQMGSFVPAKSAHIGIVDKVFSRIGASDDLSRGQSTFMVEMTETANILHNATSRSLVILDEIGRGTSTYDGISIAWAVAEHLLTTEGKYAKTLFATHYWELTKLEEKIEGAVNYHVAVHESEDSIVFLRKIVRGSTDKSYGIHVGRLAGLPSQVIVRAKEILAHLEENANRKGTFEPTVLLPKKKKKVMMNTMQLTFF